MKVIIGILIYIILGLVYWIINHDRIAVSIDLMDKEVDRLESDIKAPDLQTWLIYHMIFTFIGYVYVVAIWPVLLVFQFIINHINEGERAE